MNQPLVALNGFRAKCPKCKKFYDVKEQALIAEQNELHQIYCPHCNYVVGKV